jgi:CheY-like chemotaxis protein
VPTVLETKIIGRGVPKPKMAKQFQILVAEDDPNDAFFLERALDKSGVKVPIRFLKDGQQVIDYLEHKAPSSEPSSKDLPTLLLLDLKMPRINGFEVLEWIQQQPKLEKMMVVVFSSSGLEEDKRRAFALGADDYIVKPSYPAELLKFAKNLTSYWTEPKHKKGTKSDKGL